MVGKQFAKWKRKEKKVILKLQEGNAVIRDNVNSEKCFISIMHQYYITLYKGQFFWEKAMNIYRYHI